MAFRPGSPSPPGELGLPEALSPGRRVLAGTSVWGALTVCQALTVSLNSHRHYLSFGDQVPEAWRGEQQQAQGSRLGPS